MAGLKDNRGFIDKERLDLPERKAIEFWLKRWCVDPLNLPEKRRSFRPAVML